MQENNSVCPLGPNCFIRLIAGVHPEAKKIRSREGHGMGGSQIADHQKGNSILI